MNTLKSIGKVRDLIISTKPSTDGKTRAKATVIDINKKKILFPRKTVHSSANNLDEISLFRKEFDIPTVTEIMVQITPKRLREIIADPIEHQKVKDNITKILSETDPKGLNFGYPYLLNQRSPGESKEHFEPFGKPTQKMIEKIFDLFDVEHIDGLIFPVPSPNGNSYEWGRLSADIFTKRKPDFLNEVIFSGMVPIGNPKTDLKSLINYYLEQGLQSLTFDFCGRKVLESNMRELIDDVGDKWKDLYVHGTNVPSNNFMGTFREPALASYDLLVSVYGFDSFGNIVKGVQSDLPEKDEIKTKMRRKRFRIIGTYGDYNYEGLKMLSEHEALKCNSPIWKTNNPLDIYDDKTISLTSFKQLSNELRSHRSYVTHKEINNYNKLIETNKYLAHIENKKDASKELDSILTRMNVRKLNHF